MPDDAEAPKKAAKKVTIRKSVAERISVFNVSGELKKEVRLSSVALALSKLEEKDALEVLDSLLEASDGVDDPNAFVCAKAQEVAQTRQAEAEAKAAAEEGEEAGEGAEGEEEEWEEGEVKEGEAKPKRSAPERAVRRRVKKLNDGEALWEPIRYKRLVPIIPLIGFEEFLPIMDMLEQNSEEIGNPTAFLRKEAMKKLGPVLQRCDRLNQSVPGKMDLLAPIDLAQVKEPLAKVPRHMAFAILKELEERVFDIKDPTSWVIEEVEKKLPSGPLADQIQELNQGGQLQKPLDLLQAMEILKPIDEEKGLGILKVLSGRATNVRNPMGWLASEVRCRLQPPQAGFPAPGFAPQRPGMRPPGPWAPGGRPPGFGVPQLPAPPRSGRVAPTTPPKRPPPRPPGTSLAAAAAAKRPRLLAAVAAAVAAANQATGTGTVEDQEVEPGEENPVAEAAADEAEVWDETAGETANMDAFNEAEACEFDDVDADAIG